MEQKFGINSLNLQVLREFCEHEGKMVEYFIDGSIFPSFHIAWLVRTSPTKVLQFSIKARGQQFKSIILEGVKSAASQISLCRK